jgi:hypothetical protein
LAYLKTKLNSKTPLIANISLLGYTFISQPSNSFAGGVGFYIKEAVNYNIREDLRIVSQEMESLWIEIDNHKNKNIICGVIYRHPNSNLDSFLEQFYSVLDTITTESKLCIIMGDFNINLLNFESHHITDDFVNTLSSFLFQPHILQPTRITNHSATLIDNIFFNSLEHSTISGNILSDLSDHLPNFLFINRLNIFPHKTKRFKRCYSELNQTALLAEVQSWNWNSIIPQTNDVNLIFSAFYTKITEAINNHIPLIPLSKKQVKLAAKPWITSGLKKSIDTKNSLYRKCLVSQSFFFKAKYKVYRNKLNHLILLSKKLYHKGYFNLNRFNIKNTWKGIKQIICLKHCSVNIPKQILKNKQYLINPKSI